jgi:hypothetical protein
MRMRREDMVLEIEGTQIFLNFMKFVAPNFAVLTFLEIFYFFFVNFAFYSFKKTNPQTKYFLLPIFFQIINSEFISILNYLKKFKINLTFILFIIFIFTHLHRSLSIY